MNTSAFWSITPGTGPLVATAIHNGHQIRADVAPFLTLGDKERLREEDPFTGQWATIADTQVVAHHSRFEVDLNRPREKAVYLTPADAWGLHVWNAPLPPAVLERSLAQYDAFYAEMEQILVPLANRFDRFVVFDLHTYNHLREGSAGPPANPAQNPEVNIGTGTMPRRDRWAPLIDRFMADLRAFDFAGRHLDVRENIKFQGGHFSRWVHQNFANSACVLSIEFKKFFMDEWSGEPDQTQLQTIHQALQSTIPGVLETLQML